jgi:DNA invertase Pin-like site-specific DNA recombinase
MRVAIYARVSREDQRLEVQTEALESWLRATGHEPVVRYVDKVSGATRSRHELDSMMEAVVRDRSQRPGEFEAIAIVKLDRLARSTQHLLELASTLEASGVDLMVKDQAIDTSTPAGKLMFHILGAVAEFERDLISERTKAGLEAARKRGAKIGRPRRELDLEAAGKMLDIGETVSEIARKFGVPRTTLGEALRR